MNNIQNRGSRSLSGVKKSYVGGRRAQDQLAAKEFTNQTIDEVFDGNPLQTQLFSERCKDTNDKNEGK